MDVNASDVRLWEAAKSAREKAHAPFSGFRVGAALETTDGQIIGGCNVESASYGLTVCAERIAIFKAVSEGNHAFKRICIVADTRRPTSPCGACRQLIWEFCGDAEVLIGNLEGITMRMKMSELLPLAFDKSLL